MKPREQMDERWKSISDYPDYEVSSFGRVRRITDSYRFRNGRRQLNRRGGYFLKKTYQKGYACLGLVKNKVQKGFKISILVCTAFHGSKPSSKHEVAHNDGNNSNDFYKNLRWATKSENELDKIKHGTHNRGSQHGASKLIEEQVKVIRRLSYLGFSDTTIAEKFKVNPGTIHGIRTRKWWSWMEDHHV